jgi:beta-glucosidase
MGWEVYPAGLTEVLRFAASRTGRIPIYITENGAAYPDDPADPTRDPQRVSYLRRHLHAALDAIDQGVPLRGYFVWSLLDNFEWAFGYTRRFGIVHVDFDTLERRTRDSGRFLSQVAGAHCLPPPDDGA